MATKKNKPDRTRTGETYTSKHKLVKAQSRHESNIRHRGGRILESYYDKKTGKYITRYKF